MNNEKHTPPAVRSLFRDIAPASAYWQAEYARLSDMELRAVTDVLHRETADGVPDKKRMPRAFGLAGEVCRRALGMTPYPVQYLAAASLASGEIAQMNTGEGKTLTSVLPAFFRALDGHGVHVITVNEYLARRDYEWNRPAYALLGLSVGLSLSGMGVDEKQRAYDADVTYSTATEAGFDFLRDGIAPRRDLRVQKELYYALIDEADSILLDEAVTPMILSGGGESDTRNYVVADTLVKHLKKTVYASLEDDEREADDFEGDYVVDEKRHSAFLTAEGIRKAEQYYRTDNLFKSENAAIYHYILQAMDAHGTLKRDVDYIVRDGRVQLVDAHTGRVMDGRRYAAGLHQAVEAKEGLDIHAESRTLSEITYQKYFMNYRHIAGMTGTAWEERREFGSTFGLRVRRIPTNRPCARIDRPDQFFQRRAESLAALTRNAEAAWKSERPVLIGTPDDRTSEEVSSLLTRVGVPHRVLSAKQNADEAALIAGAGMPGSVVVATNMAGRGTDILPGGGNPVLANRVAALGGLLVLGAQRQRSRRVDRQLAGRSGRQGNPGESIFFVSAEDDLMRLYGDGRLDPRAVLRAQERAQNADAEQRAAALEADAVLQIHRAHILSDRNRLLETDEPAVCLREIIRLQIDLLIADYPEAENNFARFRVAFVHVFGRACLPEIDGEPDAGRVYACVEDVLAEKEAQSGGLFDELARSVLLQCVDEEWTRFLEAYEELKEGYHMMSFSGRKPHEVLVESSSRMLEETNRRILSEGLRRVFLCRLEKSGNPTA